MIATTTAAAVVTWVCAVVAAVSFQVRLEPSIPLALSMEQWSAEGDSATTDVSVASSQPWSAEDDQPWLEVTPTSGRRGTTVELAAEPNTTGQERSARLTVNSAGTEQTLVVRQAVQKVPPLLDIYDWDTTSRGGTTTVEVTATGSWTAQSDQDWAQTEVDLETSQLRLTVGENASAARTAFVTVTDSLDSTRLAISQTGPGDEPVLHLSLKKWKPSAAAASRPVEVTCIEPWVATTDQTWLSLDPSSGGGDATMVLVVTANTSSTSRTATVEVSCGLQAGTVTVTQAGTAPRASTPSPSPAPSPSAPWTSLPLPWATPAPPPPEDPVDPPPDPVDPPEPPDPVDPVDPPEPVDVDDA